MFCQKCGTENEDRAKFCIGCGEKIESPSPQPVTIIKKEIPLNPKPLLIFIGIALIASLYILPIHTILYKSGATMAVTTSGLVTTCGSPGWNCPPTITIGFYLIWLLGLGLIVYGIFQKKVIIPPTP
jgi:hypothetical protein